MFGKIGYLFFVDVLHIVLLGGKQRKQMERQTERVRNRLKRLNGWLALLAFNQ